MSRLFLIAMLLSGCAAKFHIKPEHTQNLAADAAKTVASTYAGQSLKLSGPVADQFGFDFLVDLQQHRGVTIGSGRSLSYSIGQIPPNLVQVSVTIDHDRLNRAYRFGKDGTLQPAGAWLIAKAPEPVAEEPKPAVKKPKKRRVKK